MLRAAGCVYAEDEARILLASAGSPPELAEMVERRATGMPLEQVVGWAEFCGLRVEVAPGVFVPRPRSEFLAELAAALTRPDSVVVDACCGSGALGAAVASSVGGIRLFAVDRDPVAVGCAGRNVARWGGVALCGDLLDPLPDDVSGAVGLIVANVPYVPTDEIRLLPAEARLHEPALALDGGADGLGVLRRLAGVVPRWLAPGGYLLIECTEAQAHAAADAFSGNGLVPAVAWSDEYDATVVVGLLS